jgi:poly(3-hydroxybutyrate) depolymerase
VARGIGPRLLFRILACVTYVAFVACKTQDGAPKNVLASNEAWCPSGFEVGPSDTCFAIPDPPPKNAPILVYLHGMFEGHGSAEEWARVRDATRRGFAVVVPRGKRGNCAWTAELQNHFCWPQETEDPASFKHVVAEWDRVLWQVEALLEEGTHKRYVLGFGNGGAFASHLAANGFFDGSAFAIVHAEALAPHVKSPKAPPILLVAAQDDAKMKELHDGLARAGWPHAYCPRAGGAALAAEDVDVALRFFKREADGMLKSSKGEKGEKGEIACEGGPPKRL